MKSIFIFVFVLLTTCSYAQTDKIKRIDSLLQAANQRGIFNGNALVAQKGKIIYLSSFGYADATKSKMLTPTMRFDIGSISKEFNGVSIMILKERGKLTLEDKVSKYVTFLPSWADKIQIKHLIQYTSGLPASNASSEEEVRTFLTQLPKLEFEPGTAFIYSYLNVYLQRWIIEKISRLNYTEFVKKYIFKPCKMSQTVIDAYTIDVTTARPFDNNFVEPANFTQSLTGWLRLPIEDLYRWTTCLHSYQLISETSFKELAESFGDNETSLGSTEFENQQLTWHQHHGSNFNYEALMSCNVKEDITIILMTNNQNFKVYPLKDAIHAILHDKPYSLPKKSVYLDLREKVLKDFEQGLAFYRHIRETQQDIYDFSFEIGDLISTGKYLMRRQKFDEAIRIFQLSLLLNGKSEDTSYNYELTGECYMRKGLPQMAILFYTKAAETNPQNKNAQGMRDKLLSQL
ncbi:serine hydrolase [Cytophagaceae bacterium YF14B1]|uniref:Serine hydrolase n=1 Tax=Xanthocytophaga flava TaxID=3048013 RepID=A0AAE3UAB3_9BACT|nr:serine hydrolase [Xanthocytophaga flavus]MDJ1485371.1 serine hydrolase [Xanthocytophaga flavus]